MRVAFLLIAVLVASASAAITYVPKQTFRCGATAQGMSRNSFCAYAASCDYDFSKLTSRTSTIEASGATKTVSCSAEGVTLVLQYTYDSTRKECTYSVDTVAPYGGQLHVVIDRMPASLVWNATTTDLVRTNPHASVSGDTTLCAALRNFADYTCAAPLVRSEPPNNVPQSSWYTFCQPLVRAQIECGTALIECSASPSLTDYSCSSLSDFDMQCSHVDRQLVGRMINGSQSACNSMGRQCVQRIASRDAARALATNTNTTYIPGSYEQDQFACAYPKLGPYNTTLCDLPSQFSATQANCFGRAVTCESQTGPAGAHICSYRSTAADLNAYCSVPQQDNARILAPEYALDAQLAQESGLQLESRSRFHVQSARLQATAPRKRQLVTVDLTAARNLLTTPSHGWSLEALLAPSLENLRTSVRASVKTRAQPRLAAISQHDYTQAYEIKATVDQKLCSYLLQTCGNYINCTTSNTLANTTLWNSRSTYCTEMLPSSCTNFGAQPTNWANASSTLVRCRKTATAYHNVLCSPISGYTGSSCYVWCRVQDASSLTLSAWPVRMSAILKPGLSRQSICAAIYTVATSPSDGENVLYDGSAPPTNSFSCASPYLTLSRSDMCTDSASLGLSGLADHVTMDCGDASLVCTRNGASTFVALTGSADGETLNSSLVTYTCQDTGSTPGVSFSAGLVPDSSVASRDCVAIRNSPGAQLVCPTPYSRNGQTYSRVNTSTIFCRTSLQASAYPRNRTLTCGNDISIRCGAYNSATRGPVYECVGSQFDMTDSFANTIYCPAVSAWNLNVSESTADACLTIKRECPNGGGIFSCNPKRLQNADKSQFCDSRVPSVRTARTVLAMCGAHPTYTVNCSSAPSGAAHDWLWCQLASASLNDSHPDLPVDYASNYLDLGCMVHEDAIDAITTRLELTQAQRSAAICAYLQSVCNLPAETCNPSVSYCPDATKLAASHATCNAPAQMCDGLFCQIDPYDSGSVPLLDASQNVGICQTVPAWNNITCEGFDISCFRQSSSLNAFPAHANFTCRRAYSTVDGYLTAGRDLFMDCSDVPFSDFVADQPYHTCLRIGRRCLMQSLDAGLGAEADASLECSNAWLATSEQPFCRTPARPADTGSVFTCDDLVVHCVPDGTDTTRTRCSSLPGSLAWTIGSNRNPARYPTPPGKDGCVLEPANFYVTAATRCAVLNTHCQTHCMPGYDFATASDNITTNPQFCRDRVDSRRSYSCEGQRVVCELQDGVSTLAPASATVTSADLEAFLLDPERLRHARQLRCYSPSVVDGLVLDCPVNKNNLLASNNVCQAILAECFNNLGTLECRDPHIATPQHPFCSQVRPSGDEAFRCDCGVWWSGALNEGTQWTPASLVSLTCAKRGLSPVSLTTDQLTTQWWKRAWCSTSAAPTVPVCATRPGMGPPLCTVECAPGMVKTTLPWMDASGTAEYCCAPGAVLRNGTCADTDDPRNCVLGQHGSPYMAANSAAVPQRMCPRNILVEQTMWPNQPATADSDGDRFAAARFACYSDPDRCRGWTTFRDPALGAGTTAAPNTGGLYFFDRQPSFSTQHLTTLDPARQHALDDESVYHLHNFQESQRSRSVVTLQQVSLVSGIEATTYVLERAYGYACKDQRIDAAYLLDKNSVALARIQDRVNRHLTRRGAGAPVLAQMDYRTRASTIKTTRLQDTIVGGQFVYANLLVVNLDDELLQDVSDGLGTTTTVSETIAALSLAQQLLANGTNLGGAVTASGLPSASLLAARMLLPNYHALAYTVPLMGLSNQRNASLSVLRRTVQVSTTVPGPTVIVGAGTSAASTDTTVLAWYDIVDPKTRLVKFATFYDLFLYFAVRTQILYGYMRTFDTDRWGQNAQCALNTPLWRSALPDQYCQVPVCPLPPSRNYNWGLGVPSTTPSPTSIYPDVSPDQIQRDYDTGIPCDGKGVCITATGKCACDSFFLASTGMLNAQTANGIRHVPTSLQAETAVCSIDVRNKCNNPSRGITNMCSGNGECVVAFINNRQTAVCECGSFPVDPDQSQDPTGLLTCNQLKRRTCEIHNLAWLPSGFEGGTASTQNLCSVPRAGCRSDDASGTCRRDGQLGWLRGDCYGCEYPRGDLTKAQATGICLPETPLSTTDPNYGADAAAQTWSCQCKPGQYGRLCQYVTVNQGCYDTATESELRQTGSAASSTRETHCVWNTYTAQYETEAETTLSASAMLSAPRTLCRGVECSGNGVCSHPGMNTAADDFVRGAPSPSTSAIERTRLRRLNQTCVCLPGWTGTQCQTRTCVGGCGTGNKAGYCKSPPNGVTDPRILPQCACPMRADGTILVGGSRCDGDECQGRGTLVRGATPFVNATCACRAPYYQGQQTNRVCADICQPPGQLVTFNVSATRTQTVCACTLHGVQRQCSDLSDIELLVLSRNDTSTTPSSPSNSSSSTGVSNGTTSASGGSSGAGAPASSTATTTPGTSTTSASSTAVAEAAASSSTSLATTAGIIVGSVAGVGVLAAAAVSVWSYSTGSSVSQLFSRGASRAKLT